jgi:thioredoxin 1
MSELVLHVGDADFAAQVLESSTPVLVDFWAEWCGPCKAIGPMVDELAKTYAGKAKVVKVNVDHNQQVARQFQIRGLPTLLLFKNGKVEATQMGAPGNLKALLTQMLDKAIA